MALLERGLKQRIVGALVLIALAVIFLPMLFTREDESRQVVVEAPPRPQAPAMPSVEVQPTEVPELQPGEEDIAPEIVEEPVIQRAEADRLRDQLSKQQKLNGFVVRFQPERG